MEAKYVYVKQRSEFGKQCIFDTCGPNLDEEIRPHPQEMHHYIHRNVCHSGTQYSKQLALHEAQTASLTTKSTGMFHFEGGWPKEINARDMEVTARYRRRVEKDEEWPPKLRKLFDSTERCVLQNGAINIHEYYFDDMIPTKLVKEHRIRTLNMCSDRRTPPRPVNDIHWSPDETKIVVSYCALNFTASYPSDYGNEIYIWNIENLDAPYIALETSCPTVVSEFNPRDPFLLASGLMSGQVCNWDLRKRNGPIATSSPQFSHRYPANAVRWVHAKTNTEFFSTSSDGRVCWWDTRKLVQPIEELIIDLEIPNDPSISRSIGISAANFEPAIATRFMFGLENGMVISGARKAKTFAEKLALRFYTHNGPVLGIDRNLLNPRVFLTVGDFNARIWSEDTREGSLISTRSTRVPPTQGCWNKVRNSIFYLIDKNGYLQAWDLLEGMAEPLIELRLSEKTLTALAAHENGSLLAVGNSVGDIFVTESSKSFVQFDKEERQKLLDYFERCTRYTKAVDSRLKEIKLGKNSTTEEVMKSVPVKSQKTKKDKSQAAKAKTEQKIEKRSSKRNVQQKKKLKDESPELMAAEENYFVMVEQEKANFPLDDDSDLMLLMQMKRYELKEMKDQAALRESERDDGYLGDEKEKRYKRMEEQESLPAKKARAMKLLTTDDSSSLDAISRRMVKTIAPMKRQRKGLTAEKGKTRPTKFAKPPYYKPCVAVCKARICCRWGRRDSRSKKTLPRTKEARGKDKRITRQIMEPYTEFDGDVSEAKRTVRGDSQRKRVPGRPLADSDTSRDKRHKFESGSIRKIEWKESKDPDIGEIGEASLAESVRDLYDSRKPESVWKEMETLFVHSGQETMEREAELGKSYLEDLEASHKRVYPRISDFHSVEQR